MSLRYLAMLTELLGDWAMHYNVPTPVIELDPSAVPALKMALNEGEGIDYNRPGSLHDSKGREIIATVRGIDFVCDYSKGRHAYRS